MNVKYVLKILIFQMLASTGQMSRVTVSCVTVPVSCVTVTVSCVTVPVSCVTVTVSCVTVPVVGAPACQTNVEPCWRRSRALRCHTVL